MNPQMIKLLMRRIVLAGSLMAIGCEQDPDHLRPMTDLVQKQAAPQESLVRQSERLTDASRQLVTADSESRRELVEFQSALQTRIDEERQALDRQRDGLDEERRAIAQQRHRDPLIAAALIQAATLLVAALPVLLIAMLIRGARQEPADTPMGEILVEELRSDRPRLEWDASHPFDKPGTPPS